jgi:hypothetical protein
MIKKFLSLAAIATVGAIFSCQTDDNALATQSGVSSEAIAKIQALGFSTDNVQLVDDGYLVEGDIILRNQDLDGAADSKILRIAEVEQYHTYNLVKGLPRTITVSASSDASAAFSNAVNNAIARYNAQNLNITMQRVASGGDINIRLVNTGQYIASAGFPDQQGNPYGEVKYAKRYATGYSDGFMTTVLAHEMGHCIGFRHTDYMNRSYSCGGSGGNEGAGSVGAVHIPGTPTDPDKASWMLACLSATTDRPFNANDKTALNYLY